MVFKLEKNASPYLKEIKLKPYDIGAPGWHSG